MRTRRQLDVVSAVAVHKAAGEESHDTQSLTHRRYTHTHTQECKLTYIYANAGHTQSLTPPPPNIYLAAHPGSMQSWMSATQEFFCSESMVSRMYSPPFSTCGSSRALRSKRRVRPRKRPPLHAAVSYLEHKRVVLVGHLQRHGGPNLHDGRQRDAHFGL